MNDKELEIHRANIEVKFAEHALELARERMHRAKAAMRRSFYVYGDVQEKGREFVDYIRARHKTRPSFGAELTWNRYEAATLEIWDDADLDEVVAFAERFFELSPRVIE